MCLFPTRATLDPNLKIPRKTTSVINGKKITKFSHRTGITIHPEGELLLPCGKCNECITLRATDWALRAQHEASLHKNNCFITLTYDDENLPSIFIEKQEFQLFLKKLRSKLHPHKISYIVSHEYGTKTFRPHHHVMIFGYDPKDQEYLRTTKKGYKLFTSPEISKLWKHGFHSIGEANAKTAYYIAAYSLKGKSHELIHPHTGESRTVNDSFDCSKRPGIGLNYLTNNIDSILNSGDRIPRYYVKKMSELFPDKLEEYENNIQTKIKTRSSNQIYAKYKLDEVKKIISDSEFRKSYKKDSSISDYLKIKAREFTDYVKGDKK